MHVSLRQAALLLQHQPLRRGLRLQVQLLPSVELKEGRRLLRHLLTPLQLLLQVLLLLLLVPVTLLLRLHLLLLWLLRRRREDGSLLHGDSCGQGVQTVQQCGGDSLEHRSCSNLCPRALQQGGSTVLCMTGRRRARGQRLGAAGVLAPSGTIFVS